MNAGCIDQLIGIEIGGTKLQLVTGNVEASVGVNKRIRYAIDASLGATGIRKQIQKGLSRLVSENSVKAIGVGFGGPVNWQTGAIQLSHQVEGWGNFNLQHWLEELSGLPVAVDNDANTAALAEAMYGCGKGNDTVFYMTIGSGIGGGLVIDQSIYHGRTPGEVEIGHVRLNKSGVTLENECSGWAVNKKVAASIQQQPNGMLAKLAMQMTGPGAPLLTPALEAHDASAKKIVDEIADNLAFALSHVVHLFNPDTIIIGGGLSMLGDYLKKPLAAKLPNYLLQALLPAPEIQLASLGEDVVPIGALELARKVWKQSQTI